jgi:DNA-binding MarR family transcriptional regulator
MPSINDIDNVIHGKVRLGIMAYLSTTSPVSFPILQKVLNTSQGNLSTHLAKLERAEFVNIEKGYSGKRPQTLVYLTDQGRDAWVAYLEAIKDLLGL